MATMCGSDLTEFEVTLKRRLTRGRTVPELRLVWRESAEGIEGARDLAANLVDEAADAFGDDRQALRDYGYEAARDSALDAPEDGVMIDLPNGNVIEVRRVSKAACVECGRAAAPGSRWCGDGCMDVYLDRAED